MYNTDIRAKIAKKGLKHLDVAKALNISPFTFSHWLQFELPQEKKKEILKVINEMK